MPPGAPVKLLPPPDLSSTPSLYEQLPLVITLNPLEGAVAYRAQIASDQNFESLRTEFTTGKLPFRDGDIPDGDYWLRVRGIDVNGIEGYDAVIAFTLNARPEPPFILATFAGWRGGPGIPRISMGGAAGSLALYCDGEQGCRFHGSDCARYAS